MKEADRQIDSFGTYNSYLRLCLVAILTLWLSMSCFYAYGEDKKPLNVNMYEGLSKELEDSLIKAEKEGRLVNFFLEKEAYFRDKGRFSDLINMADWVEAHLPKEDIGNLVLTYEIRSSAYFSIGDYEAMFRDIEKALDIPKEDNLLFLDATLYLNIMDFHAMYHRLDLAQQYLNKAKEIVSKHKSSENNKASWNNVYYLIHLMQSQLFRLNNNLDSANNEYSNAKKYAATKRQDLSLKTQKFLLLMDKHDYSGADSIYNTYLADDTQVPFMISGGLRMEYIRMLMKIGNINKAKYELKKIMPDSIHINDQPNLYCLLSDLYTAENNYPLACYYLNKHIQLKDSLESKYKSTYATQVADRFEMRQVQKSLDKERRENSRNILFIGLLVVALISTGIVVIIVIRRHRKRKRDQIIAETNLGNRNAALSSAVMVADSYKNICQDIKAILSSDESAAKKIADINLRLKESSTAIEPLHHVNNSNEEALQEFIDKLRYVHPNLTNAEMRMAQLVFMNISNKDIAELQKRSIGTIKNQKYSLRKKLGTDLPMETYLKQLSAASPSELEELANSVQHNA